MTSITQVHAITSYPPNLVTPSDLLDEFRGILRTKFQDMESNYVYRVHKNGIIFLASKEMKCGNQLIRPNETASQITFAHSPPSDFQKTDIRVIRYLSCDGKVDFSEEITLSDPTTATPALPDLDAEIVFRKKLLLFETDNYKKQGYRLLGHEQEEIFSIQRVQDSVGFFYEFRILGQTFLTIYSKQAGEQQLHSNVNLREFSFLYRHEGHSLGVSRPAGGILTIQTTSIEKKMGQQLYINSNRQGISKGEFNGLFQKHVISTCQKIQYILEEFLDDFPQTSLIATGVQNSRVLDELRLASVRLLQNRDLNLVRLLVLDYISSIEKGLMKVDDRRPKQ